MIKEICWLLLMGSCLASGRYKVRHPGVSPYSLPPGGISGPPPHQMFKKNRPIGHRMSMGNTFLINNNNLPMRLPSFNKPQKFRNRRPPPPPPPMFDAPVKVLKNPPMIMRVPPASIAAILPEKSAPRIPEYSAEYHYEPMAVMPIHGNTADDDKGPIHTIPAPNLSLADAPYNNNYPQNVGEYRRNSSETEYHANPGNNYGIGSVVNGMTPQKPVTNPPQSNYYEVTETNELLNARDQYQAGASVNFDGPQFTQDDLNGNEINAHNYPASRISLMSPNSRYSSLSPDGMQADLRSSLHVVFPDSESSPSNSEQLAAQEPAEILANDQQQQMMQGLPFFRQPLSTTQLHGILNSFPYNKDQQQLEQFPQLGASSMMTFSQPQMHPFHYEEQSNEQQQQQQQLMTVEQDYGTDQVSPDDNNNRFEQNPHLNAARGKQDMDYVDDTDFEVKPTTANSIDEQENLGTVGSYSVLPSRQAAEKLAALAAAGNVNSQLIKKLKKQQSDNKFGLVNHKETSYHAGEQSEEEGISDKMDTEEPVKQENFDNETKQSPQIEETIEDGKSVLRIMIPDVQESTRETTLADSKKISSSDEDYDEDEYANIEHESLDS